LHADSADVRLIVAQLAREESSMLNDQMTYEQLPPAAKDMLTREQWEEARTTIVMRGEAIPQDGTYLNLIDGELGDYMQGDPASDPLLLSDNLPRAVASGGTHDRTQPAADRRSRAWGE
jgi:hypothetical protein